jgi:AbrB family looped-hinge helix DNA binding protein
LCEAQSGSDVQSGRYGKLTTKLLLLLFLPRITRVQNMEITSVTSKGQVSIPKPVRQRLGLRQGSKVEFVVVGDHVEMRVFSAPLDMPVSGFGMLKSKRAAAPADLDPATLLTQRMGLTPRVTVPK